MEQSELIKKNVVFVENIDALNKSSFGDVWYEIPEPFCKTFKNKGKRNFTAILKP